MSLLVNGLVRSKGTCLAVRQSGTVQRSRELENLLELGGWQVDILEHQGPIPITPVSFNLILVEDISSKSASEISSLKNGSTLLAGVISGPFDASVIAPYDILFLGVEGQSIIDPLRRLGKAAFLVPASPSWASRCLEILNRQCSYRSEPPTQVDWSRISYGHAEISPDQVTGSMTSAWQSEEIPGRQRALVQSELLQMYRGRIPQVYQTLADALKPYSKEGLSILEIGCASGYYFEILEYLLSHKFAYEGVDYSSALIRMAKNLYPLTPFHVADGARLPFVNNHFPVVISSCILLHVPNFRDHIRETARVAGKVVIAHRTPVCRNRPTQYIKKFAYSVETVELLFNEAEILSVFKSHGLIKVNAIELDGSVREDNFCITYVFEKTTSGNSSSEYSSSEKENDFITLIAQGEAAFSSGNFELSHKLLHRAALLNPESSRLLCDLGVLSCQAGDLEGGLILMQRACTNDQHNRKSLVNLVEILDTLMRSREAWPWLDRYLELHPTDTEIRSLRNA